MLWYVWRVGIGFPYFFYLRSVLSQHWMGTVRDHSDWPFSSFPYHLSAKEHASFKLLSCKSSHDLWLHHLAMQAEQLWGMAKKMTSESELYR